MAREIVLDTETTGLDPLTGHRLIEIGRIEVEDLLLFGCCFFCVMDPERLIDPEAIRVHGITDAMVKGKPRFHELCEELLEFVGDAQVVAHNAAFDRGFVNFELEKAGRTIIDPERLIDTLKLAQQRVPGMYNSLDALCKRFKISLAAREKHGALIDAKLLAMVYLELRGGKERGLDLGPRAGRTTVCEQVVTGWGSFGARPRALLPLSTREERAAHAACIDASF